MNDGAVRTLRAKLAFASPTAFVRDYGQHITEGGIFIASTESFAAGERVGFQLELRSGQRILAGEGTVEWTCEAPEDAAVFQLPGVGLRFTSLEPASRKLIELIVATRGRSARSPAPPRPGETSSPPTARAPAAEAARPEPARPTAVELPAPARPRKKARAQPPAPVVRPELAEAIAAAQRYDQLPPNLEACFEPAQPRAVPEPSVIPSPAAAAIEPQSVPPTPAERPTSIAAAPPPEAPDLPVAPPAPAALVPSAPAGSGTAASSAAEETRALQVSRAHRLMTMREYEKAEHLLQQSIAADPGDARLRFELGQVYFEWSDQTGEHDESAEAAFARAAQLDVSFDQPLVMLAQVQLRRGLHERARRSYREALRRNPHSRAARDGLTTAEAVQWRKRASWVARGVAVVIAAGIALAATRSGTSFSADAPERTGRPRAAEEALRPGAPARNAPALAAERAEPGPPPSTPPAEPPPAAGASPAPAVAAAPVPAPPPAVSSPEPAPREPVARAPIRPAVARRDPPAPPRKPRGPTAEGLARQGDAAVRLGKVDEALAAFNKALALDSAFAPAHRGLGAVFMMQGRDAEAASAYRKYLAAAPTAADADRIRALLDELQ